MHAETVLRTNLISWLRDQARLSFTFDNCSRRYHVKKTVVPSYQPVFSSCSHAITHIVEAAKIQRLKEFPNLSGCLMYQKWKNISADRDGEITEKIDNALSIWGYDDFQFLDHGERAFAFRTLHRPSGERRVLRVEAPHMSRQDRPVHPTVAIAHHSLQCDELGGIKIETCDEFVPLNKIPDAKKFHSPSSPFYRYYNDLCGLAHGTNMTYAETYFDEDSEPQNVGLSPSGHVMTFDPQIIKGKEALSLHREFKDPYILRDASTAQLRLVYGRPFVENLERK